MQRSLSHPLAHTLMLVLLLAIPAGFAHADVFRDFGISDLQAIPVSTGGYLVTVDVTTTPGSTPPSTPISLNLLVNGVIVRESNHHPRNEWPQCCSSEDDCKSNGGGVKWTCFGSTCSDGARNSCTYQRRYSFDGLAISPGVILTARMDPLHVHVETDPGADADNERSIVVPPFAPTGDAFEDLSVSDLQIQPAGEGFYSVSAKVAIGPEAIAPAQPIQMVLLQNGSPLAYASHPTASTGAEICCYRLPCPSQPGMAVDCLGQCHEQSDESVPPMVCTYSQESPFGTFALTPGTTLTVVLDPDHLHTETGLEGTSNNSATAIVPGPSVGAGESMGLRLAKSLPTSELLLTWAASCHAGDSDYAVFEGTLGSFASHVALGCSTGGTTHWTMPLVAGSRYYLVVPRNGPNEGSFGRSSNGQERPAGVVDCGPQMIVSCP